MVLVRGVVVLLCWVSLGVRCAEDTVTRSPHPWRCGNCEEDEAPEVMLRHLKSCGGPIL